MAETDILTYLLPTLISAAIAFIILGLQRFTRTSDDSLKSVVKLEGVDLRIIDCESQIKDVKHDAKEFSTDVWDHINEIEAMAKLTEWRLAKLEKYSNGNNHK